MKKLLAAITAAALTLSLTGPALASPPPAVTPTISINQSPVSFGDSVTFATTIPKGTHNPWVSLSCYQIVNGVNTLVYGEGGSPDHVFVLGGASSAWIGNGGGPASCSAELGDLYWRGGQEFYTFLATTSFPAI